MWKEPVNFTVYLGLMCFPGLHDLSGRSRLYVQGRGIPYLKPIAHQSEVEVSLLVNQGKEEIANQNVSGNRKQPGHGVLNFICWVLVGFF